MFFFLQIVNKKSYEIIKKTTTKTSTPNAKITVIKMCLYCTDGEKCTAIKSSSFNAWNWHRVVLVEKVCEKKYCLSAKATRLNGKSFPCALTYKHLKLKTSSIHSLAPSSLAYDEQYIITFTLNPIPFSLFTFQTNFIYSGYSGDSL